MAGCGRVCQLRHIRRCWWHRRSSKLGDPVFGLWSCVPAQVVDRKLCGRPAKERCSRLPESCMNASCPCVLEATQEDRRLPKGCSLVAQTSSRQAMFATLTCSGRCRPSGGLKLSRAWPMPVQVGQSVAEISQCEGRCWADSGKTRPQSDQLQQASMERGPKLGTNRPNTQTLSEVWPSSRHPERPLRKFGQLLGDSGSWQTSRNINVAPRREIEPHKQPPCAAGSEAGHLGPRAPPPPPAVPAALYAAPLSAA